jgi:hypothetical protein
MNFLSEKIRGEAYVDLRLALMIALIRLMLGRISGISSQHASMALKQ